MSNKASKVIGKPFREIDFVPGYLDAPWKARHLKAIQDVNNPIGQAISAWISYAHAHRNRFDSHIGDDYFLGKARAQWGMALLTLLNGEIDGIDAGAADAILRDNLAAQGFDPDSL